MWPFTKKKKKEEIKPSSKVIRTGTTFTVEDDSYMDPLITGFAAAYIAEELSTPSYQEESFSGFGGGSFGGAGAGAEFDSSSSSDYSSGSDSSCDSSCD